MGDITNILSGGQQAGYNDIANAYAKAQQMMQQYYNQGQGMLNPWQQAGQGAIGQYQNFLNQLPNQMNGDWMKSYQESPYAKYLTDTGLTSMNNAAAATGRLGSGANQQENAQLANQIAGQDMQNYFNNMMRQNQQYMGGLNTLMGYGAGAAGQGANLGMGFANALAQLMEGQGTAQGNASAAGTSGKNSAISGLIGALL